MLLPMARSKFTGNKIKSEFKSKHKAGCFNPEGIARCATKVEKIRRRPTNLKLSVTPKLPSFSQIFI